MKDAAGNEIYSQPICGCGQVNSAGQCPHSSPVPAAAPMVVEINVKSTKFTDNYGLPVTIVTEAEVSMPQVNDVYIPADHCSSCDCDDCKKQQQLSAPQAESVPTVTRQTIDRGQNDEYGGIKTEVHSEGDAAANEAASVQGVRTQGIGEDRQTGQLDASTDMPILQARRIGVAESVPSGKDAAREFMGTPYVAMIVGAQYVDAFAKMNEFAASQTAALTAERDQWKELAKQADDTWHDLRERLEKAE